MPSFYGGSFDDTFRLLKKHLPCDYPIVLKTMTSKQITKLAKEEYEEDFISTGLAILHYTDVNHNEVVKANLYVARYLNRELAEYILLHEYAHCIDQDTKYKEHSNSFGINYSRVWRVYCKQHNEIIFRKKILKNKE